MSDRQPVDVKTIYATSTRDVYEECYIVGSNIRKFDLPRNGHFITRIRVCDYYMPTQKEVKSDSDLVLQFGTQYFNLKSSDTTLLIPLVFIQYQVVALNWSSNALQYKKIYVTYESIDNDIVKKHIRDVITFTVEGQSVRVSSGMVDIIKPTVKAEPKDEFAELLRSNLASHDIFEIPQMKLKLNRFNFYNKTSAQALGELTKTSPAKEHLKQKNLPDCVSGVDKEDISSYAFFKEENDKVYVYYRVVRCGDLVSDIKLTPNFNVEVYDEYMKRKERVGMIEALYPTLSYKCPINLLGRMYDTYIVFGIDRNNFTQFMKLDTFSLTYVHLDVDERRLCALKREG